MTTPPILKSTPLTDEQKRLVAMFDELKKKQLDFLDEAGKRIIELTTGLLGVLFAVSAFGNDFPPPYLKGNPLAQTAVAVTLGLYVASMLCGVFAVQPRDYQYYEHNLSEMRKVLDAIAQYKSRWFTAATILFVLGSLCLALLIGAIIFGA
jgi:hypothetical protein